MTRWLAPWRAGAELAPCSGCDDVVVASTRDELGRCAQCVRAPRGQADPARGSALDVSVATNRILDELEASLPLPLWEAEAHG